MSIKELGFHASLSFGDNLVKYQPDFEKTLKEMCIISVECRVPTKKSRLETDARVDRLGFKTMLEALCYDFRKKIKE